MVAMIAHSSVFVNTNTVGSFNSINIRSEEHELPAVFVLLPFDLVFDLIGSIAVASVLHAICGDYE